ncbi:hypothetical protein NH8B_3013 [Pseudogulbenkiania sp. NH8B]|nr:hypothetical protein NH8B_3013 [Pseudogulbenkiania sp. NH8B]
MVHLLRRGAGGHVEVLGVDVQQEIAHGAPYHVRGKAGFLQTGGHFQRGMAEPVAPHSVLGKRNNARFDATLAYYACGQLEYSSN